MKNLVITTCLLSFTVGSFAQGTVIFNNRLTGTLITHVYQPLGPGGINQHIGNGTNDTPPGTTEWAGYSLVGISLNGQYGASTTFATLLSANGANQPESSLVEASQSTTFRTGGAAGNIAGITATLGNVPPDSAAATIEMVAWDNSTGLYPTYSQALAAWGYGLVAIGWSGPFTVYQIGGIQNSAPTLNGLQSFNLLYFVPEPGTFALAGLGVASMLINRRRK